MDVQVQLVSERRLARNQQKKYREVQGKLLRYWEETLRGERTHLSLLKVCAEMFDPSKPSSR